MPVLVSPALMEEPATSSLALKTTSGTNLWLNNMSYIVVSNPQSCVIELKRQYATALPHLSISVIIL